MNLIVCGSQVSDFSYGIGLNGSIPWSCKEDMKLFRKLTDGSILVVGRKTLQSMGNLKNRKVVCITRKTSLLLSTNTYAIVRSFGELDELLRRPENTVLPVFIAGGAEIYNHFLNNPPAGLKIHLSVLKAKEGGEAKFDTFVTIPPTWVITNTVEYEEFTYYTLENRGEGENQYLSLIGNILSTGNTRQTRNSETKSLFNKSLTFNLQDGFPLLTTKKMFFRGIVEELLFFIRGQTDSKILEDKGIKIWKKNTERSFLDSLEMKERKEGLMGAMYGYQWRYFNAKYDEATGRPAETGIDQLQDVINLIKTDPYSRRIIMTTFNPSQASEGVLYPCHSLIIQFYVTATPEGVKMLDMFCYNRSQDVFLGTPFNISSSALLLLLVSKVTGTVARNLHMSLGDVHIYKTHYTVEGDSTGVSPILEQISRRPYRFPSVTINTEVKNVEDLESLEFKNFVLENYVSHPAIKAEIVA